MPKNEASELSGIREAFYRRGSWWDRNRVRVGLMASGSLCTLLLFCAVWMGIAAATSMAFPLPPVRDYPYAIIGGTGDTVLASKYYPLPDGGVLVLNQDCMVRHNRLYGDMGTYLLDESIPQLEFKANSVIVKER
jgi:hypothetical protein